MIVVKAEMWKYGNPEDRYPLGELRIANDGTGTSRTGNYTARLFGADGRHMGDCEVKGFLRKRYHAFDLILWVLAKMRGDKFANIIKGEWLWSE